MNLTRTVLALGLAAVVQSCDSLRSCSFKRETLRLEDTASITPCSSVFSAKEELSPSLTVIRENVMSSQTCHGFHIGNGYILSVEHCFDKKKIGDETTFYKLAPRFWEGTPYRAHLLASYKEDDLVLFRSDDFSLQSSRYFVDIASTIEGQKVFYFPLLLESSQKKLNVLREKYPSDFRIDAMGTTVTGTVTFDDLTRQQRYTYAYIPTMNGISGSPFFVKERGRIFLAGVFTRFFIQGDLIEGSNTRYGEKAIFSNDDSLCRFLEHIQEK